MTETAGTSADEVVLRSATADDARAIAALHADSWRRHYRGAYSDHFLDNEVEADRLGVWTERLATPDPEASTIVAAADGTLIGFSHLRFDHHPAWGTLLDNLHVRADLKRGGVGTRLMAESARRVLARPSPGPICLWVLGQNTDGQAFYAARGGECVERVSRAPDSGDKLRFVWRDPAVLLD
ncbi:MAG TPA: GNAT family N-acetyltransferase [Acidimicrobiales bacterium]